MKYNLYYLLFCSLFSFGQNCYYTINESIKYKRENLVFESLFENENSIDKWNEHSCQGNSWNIKLQPVEGRKGESSVRFELRKNANEYRSELGRNKHVSLSEGWFGVSYYFPEEHVDDSSYDIISQWQAYPDFYLGENWRSPTMALATRNGEFRLEWRTSSKAVNIQGDYTYNFTTLGKVNKKIWHDWVIHVKWGYDNNGELEVWHRGKKVLDKHNFSIGYNDQHPPYFKCGIYKPDWSPSGTGSTSKIRVVCINQVRIGNQYAEYKDVNPNSRFY